MKHIDAMNDEQRVLVENSLSIARWTVRQYISSNECIVGLSKDDLTQEAYYALCKASLTYNSSCVQFNTYAVTVIYNHLIDYCRRIYSAMQNMPTLSLDEPHTNTDSYSLADSHAMDCTFEDASLSRMYARDFINKRKAEYHGCAKLGLEALELQILDGYSVSDIAKLYQTKPNFIGACISRAKKKLRSEMKD